MSKVVSMDEALNLIQDGAVLASSGFVLAGTSEAVFKALGERYAKTGRPRGLTGVFCASQGNGEGTGYDHLAQDGMIDKIIGGHFGLCPGLQKYIAQNKCQAYNFSIGVMLALFRNAIQGKPGELSKVGLRTFIDPRLQGGRVNDVTKEDIVKVVELEGEEYLYYPVPKFDVAVIRGTTADENGNVSLEHEVSPLEMRTIAMAVKATGGKVICQVKYVAAGGTMPPRTVDIPGLFVDAVVVAPDPPRDHRQTKGHYYEPSWSGHSIVPMAAIEPLPLDVRKVLARRSAMELVPNAVVNLGIGVPEGVAVVAAEEGFGDQLTLTCESGIFGGIPGSGATFGGGQNAGGLIDMRTMFDFYDGGGLDLTVLGLAEVNRRGDINVGRFGPKTPGCGGFTNISQNTGKVVFCGAFTAGGVEMEIGDGRIRVVKEGCSRKFVKEVQQITYSGDYGASTGQEVLYVTERAVFRLAGQGLLLTEIAPGIDLQRDVLDQMEFRPLIADNLVQMDERIFRKEKMGLTLS